jgi:hypothetical protein
MEIEVLSVSENDRGRRTSILVREIADPRGEVIELLVETPAEQVTGAQIAAAWQAHEMKRKGNLADKAEDLTGKRLEVPDIGPP